MQRSKWTEGSEVPQVRIQGASPQEQGTQNLSLLLISLHFRPIRDYWFYSANPNTQVKDGPEQVNFVALQNKVASSPFRSSRPLGLVVLLGLFPLFVMSAANLHSSPTFGYV